VANLDEQAQSDLQRATSLLPCLFPAPLLVMGLDRLGSNLLVHLTERTNEGDLPSNNKYGHPSLQPVFRPEFGMSGAG
jgi:hypothetical protein